MYAVHYLFASSKYQHISKKVVVMFLEYMTLQYFPVTHAVLFALLQVTTTLGIFKTIATASGPHCKRHVPIIAGPLVSPMGDSKVLTILNTYQC